MDNHDNELQVLSWPIDDINSSAGSDDICTCLYNYIEYVIDGWFQKKSSKTFIQFRNNSWFDDECKVQKRLVNNYEKVNDVHIEPYKIHFRELKTEYHHITKQKSRCYKHNIHKILQECDSKLLLIIGDYGSPLKDLT